MKHLPENFLCLYGRFSLPEGRSISKGVNFAGKALKGSKARFIHTRLAFFLQRVPAPIRMLSDSLSTVFVEARWQASRKSRV